MLEVADTDGGAHVDKGLKKEYSALSRDNSVQIMLGIGHADGKREEFPLKHPELATIRQITFEVIESFKKYFNCL